MNGTVGYTKICFRRVEHAAHGRAYQRASAELQKRKKYGTLAEIGFAS
jgi:hypothetical protein